MSDLYDNMESPQSRMEKIGLRQIELAEETNALLRAVLARLPAFKLVPIENDAGATESGQGKLSAMPADMTAKG